MFLCIRLWLNMMFAIAQQLTDEETEIGFDPQASLEEEFAARAQAVDADPASLASLFDDDEVVEVEVSDEEDESLLVQSLCPAASDPLVSQTWTCMDKTWYHMRYVAIMHVMSYRSSNTPTCMSTADCALVCECMRNCKGKNMHTRVQWLNSITSVLQINWRCPWPSLESFSSCSCKTAGFQRLLSAALISAASKLCSRSRRQCSSPSWLGAISSAAPALVAAKHLPLRCQSLNHWWRWVSHSSSATRFRLHDL